jgi:hypothetical protein
MFSSVRRRLTYANVVVTFALVFAMSGGAYAASKYLVTSTKQISPKVLKSLQGKAGKTGPAGAQGPAGPAGKEGSAGKEGPVGKGGANGSNGESVIVTSVKTKEAVCSQLGGAKFVAGGKEATACNGAEGKEGPAGAEGTFGGGSLPKGKTMRGAWALSGYGEAAFPTEPGYGIGKDAVSFAAPISPGVSSEIHYIGPTEGENEEESKWAKAIKEGKCKGFYEKPVAAEGQLCVFAVSESNLLTGPSAMLSGPSETTLGFVIEALNKAKGAFFAEGTWAVTAE